VTELPDDIKQGDFGTSDVSSPVGSGSGFTHIGEVVRYQGRMVRMSSMAWRGPDGVEFERDFVHHPGAVAVVPILDDGSIVLVSQFRTPLGRETLEIPAGVTDKPGESAAEAAARELAEETGYVARELTGLGLIHTAPGWANERIELFVARGLRAEQRNADGIEEQFMRTVVLSETQYDALVASGEVTDAKTLLGVLMVRSGS